MVEKKTKNRVGPKHWPWINPLHELEYEPDVSWPKISIVTPSYNQGQFIEETILSVINQNYPNLEYIIIDGGSTDNTTEIIKKYEKNITYWVSESDEGQSDAIEKGLHKSSGDIFNWLNSDDYLEIGALKKIAKYFLRKDTDVVCTASYYVVDGQKVSVHPQTYQGKSLLVNIGWATRLNQQGMFYRLDKVRTMGGINSSLHYCMDFELWLRYLLQYGNQKVLFSPEILSFFRVHRASKTQQFDQSGDDNSLFRNEYNSVYLYLAKKSCGAEIVKLIRTFSAEVKEAYQMHISTDTVSTDFIKKSVYYYLYAQLSFYLHKNKYRMVFRILRVLFNTRPFDLMNYKLIYAISRYYLKAFSNR